MLQVCERFSEEGGNQMGKTGVKENKMGVMPVKKLIVNMSVPMMISMLVQALYNIVDSVFVAQLGEEALTAVTLAFPLQNLMIAVGSGMGVGINAMLSKALGEKNYKESDAAAGNGLFITFINAVIFILVGLFVTGPFIKSQSADAAIIGYGDTYLSIVCSLSFGLFFQMTFERLLQSTGMTMLSMVSQTSGAVFNIIFDPIMIFGLCGFPKMGVAGAAYATILGQCFAAVLGLIMNLKFNKEIHFSFAKVIHPSLLVIRRILYVGIPTVLMMSIGSVMTYSMNLILAAFSATAVAVFGVYFKLQSFFFMPVFGLNNGLIPVLAYNYGARNKSRIDEALKFSFILAFCIMLTGTITFELFPQQLLSIFNASDDMMAMGTVALRTIAVHFPIASMGIMMGSIFQAFSESMYSLFVSLGRQLVVLIPAAYLLSLTGNVNNIWWCFLIAEIASFVLSLHFFRKLYNRKVVPLEEK